MKYKIAFKGADAPKIVEADGFQFVPSHPGWITFSKRSDNGFDVPIFGFRSDDVAEIETFSEDWKNASFELFKFPGESLFQIIHRNLEPCDHFGWTGIRFNVVNGKPQHVPNPNP